MILSALLISMWLGDAVASSLTTAAADEVTGLAARSARSAVTRAGSAGVPSTPTDADQGAPTGVAMTLPGPAAPPAALPVFKDGPGFEGEHGPEGRGLGGSGLETAAPQETRIARVATQKEIVKKLVARLQKTYEELKDFEADFTQAYLYKTFNRRQLSRGKIRFKKPGLMRWDYEAPGEKTFLVVNETFVTYDPEALQMTKGPFDRSQLSAAVTFLFGDGRLEREFHIAPGDCVGCGGTLLVLTPKQPASAYQRVELVVDPKTARVLRSTVVDPDGSENAITFENFRPNVGLEREDFKLTPAPGTRMVDMMK